MKLLDGKVAIITGASSGIGQAAATLFVAHGASLVLVARREQPLKLIVEEIRDGGGHALAVAGDVKEARTHEEPLLPHKPPSADCTSRSTMRAWLEP